MHLAKAVLLPPAALVLTCCAIKFDSAPIDRPEDASSDPDASDLESDPDVVDGDASDPVEVDGEDAGDVAEPEDAVGEVDAFDVVEDPVEEDPGEEEPSNPYSPLDYFSRDLLTEITSLPISSWTFAIPGSTRRSSWVTLLGYILAGDWTMAYSYNRTTTHLELYALRDTGASPPRDFIVLYDDTNGEGIYVFDPAPANPLMVEVPYPVMDTGTIEQGVALLRGSATVDGGWVLMVAGTDRCESSTTGICDGTTVACTGGTPENFRLSDVAHNQYLIFQVLHQALMTADSTSLAVQLMGQSDASGAYAILSDGTTTDGTGMPLGISILLRNALQVAIPGWASDILSCNDPGDASGYTSACQVSNMLGRWTNGSSNLCNEAATASADRFVVLEQDASMRDAAYHDELMGSVDSALFP